MGYMVHHAIIVSSYDTVFITRARQLAGRACPGRASNVVQHRVNGGGSFMIAPDNSKKGSEDSDRADAENAKFIASLREFLFEDGSSRVHWALVQYGDDNGDNRILKSDRGKR